MRPPASLPLLVSGPPRLDCGREVPGARNLPPPAPRIRAQAKAGGRRTGLADRVFPIQAEAHALPYAEEFFDAAVSLDSYHYYGTDELYLSYFIRFLKPGGRLGIVCPGLVQEFDEIPGHLSRPQAHGHRFWDPSEEARVLAGATRERFPSDAEALRADGGRFLTFVRVVARRL